MFSFSNLRRALLRLVREPVFAMTALLTIGLCSGANLIIFSVVDAILLRSLPFPEADRLAIVRKDYPGAAIANGNASLPNYADWKNGLNAFESVTAFRDDTVVLGGMDAPKALTSKRTTADLPKTLGVAPQLGRYFEEGETLLKAARVVVLSDDCWRANFGASPSVLGQTVTLDSQPYTVVGVMPRGFRYLSSNAALFLPLAASANDFNPDKRHTGNTQIIARLNAGETLESATAQIRALDAQQLLDDPYAAQIKSAAYAASVRSLHADHVKTVRPILLLLQGGALLLLLIGSINLTNMLFVRASRRSGEFAVRRALGAGWTAVASEVLVEILLLVGLGVIMGTSIGAAGLRLISSYCAEGLPLGGGVELGSRTACAALVGALLTALLLSIPVIWFVLKNGISSALGSGGRSGTASRRALLVRQGFVVGQIALSFVLVVCAGLLSLSLKRVLEQRPGFEADKTLSGLIALPGTRYKTQDERIAFEERVLEALRRQPGVSSAAVATSAPFAPIRSPYKNLSVITLEDTVPGSQDSLRAHLCCWVSGDYWTTLADPVLEGRALNEADQQPSARNCVVDEAFARLRWPDGKALGKRLLKDAEFKASKAYTVVGVVGRMKQEDLGEKDSGVVYFPYRHNADRDIVVILRTSQAAESMAAALRNAVKSVDPQVPVDDVRSLGSRIESSLVQRRVPALLSGSFASVALALAVLGTYGVIAYATVQRRKEIGVRLALGAQSSQVLGLFLGLGWRLLAFGLLLGLPLGFLVSGAMASFVYGAAEIDLPLLAVSTTAIALATLFAVWLPARRAARVNPVEALRAE